MTTPPFDVEEDLLDETRTEVGLADHKASLVLTALGIGFSAFFAGIIASDWDPSKLDGSAEVLWWISAAVAFASVVSAALAVWPRMGSRNLDRPIYYWGQVSRLQSLEELHRRLDDDPPERTARTRDQLWHLSLLVTRKYWWVRWAIGLGGGSFVLFLFAGLATL